ncbi:MAG: nucleotidyltransferase family protein [Candidatus Hodarchaeales archaeon]|jgi:NDP-sugar pyrophosphorylase family protein
MTTKTRITITIDPDILKQIDAEIDGTLIRSRSEAIEKFVKQYLGQQRIAIILAGGDPDSLRTIETADYRPLLPINDKTLIEYIIDKIISAGFQKIVIIGHSSLIKAIYSVIAPNKSILESIEFIEESKSLGTAKTLELARGLIKNDFLIVPCDTYFDFNLQGLYNFHLQQDTLATFAIYSRTSFDSKYKGVVELDGFRIISHEEKPNEPKSHLIKTMIGIMSPQIFEYIPPGPVEWRIEIELLSRLIDQKKVLGYPVAGDWFNIHTLKDLALLKSHLGY